MDDAAFPARDRTAYPPQPWRLCGEAQLAAWLVPAHDVAFEPPPGFTPLRIGGRLAVGAAWAQYREPGVLTYDELAVGVLVRRGLRLAVTIPWIWVDDAAALRGGRALWAIPKQPASFGGVRQPDFEIRAGDAAGVIAAARFGAARMLPGRWPFRLRLAQAAGGTAHLTPLRGRARLGLARSGWRAAGPLAFLHGRAPLLSLRLTDAALLFGNLR